MRVAIVGGVFDKSSEYRSVHQNTPETTLADGLELRGHRVVRLGHREFNSSVAYDLVHVHHLGRAAYAAASHAPRATPFVFTPHDGRLLCGLPTSRTRLAAFRYVAKNADALVALSYAEVGFLQSTAGPCRVQVIPNGIPRLYADQHIFSSREGVIFAGQLTRIKGLDTLFAAFALSLAGRGVTLSLAYHNSSMLSDLRVLSTRLGIQPNVRFLGPLQPVDLAVAYGKNRLLALSSLGESRPSVIAEAHMAGTPVVASAVGGIPEMVGRFGATVVPGDLTAWCETLQEQYDTTWTDSEREEMRERSVRDHSPERMAESHELLYETVISRGPQHQRERGLANLVLDLEIRRRWRLG